MIIEAFKLKKERKKERKKEEEKRIAELPVVRIELRTFRSSVLPLELPKVLLRQGTLVCTSEISFLKCYMLDIQKCPSQVSIWGQRCHTVEIITPRFGVSLRGQ